MTLRIDELQSPWKELCQGAEPSEGVLAFMEHLSGEKLSFLLLELRARLHHLLRFKEAREDAWQQAGIIQIAIRFELRRVMQDSPAELVATATALRNSVECCLADADARIVVGIPKAFASIEAELATLAAEAESLPDATPPPPPWQQDSALPVDLPEDFRAAVMHLLREKPSALLLKLREELDQILNLGSLRRNLFQRLGQITAALPYKLQWLASTSPASAAFMHKVERCLQTIEEMIVRTTETMAGLEKRLEALVIEAEGFQEASARGTKRTEGEWLNPPVPLTLLARRLRRSEYLTRKELLPYGLHTHGSRERWTVRIDNMPVDLRRQVQG